MPINENLIDKLWFNKEKIKVKKFNILPKKAIGQDYKLKITKLINLLKKKKIDLQFISASENIAWLLNIRGEDSDFTPIPNSFMTINSDKKINLFCDLRKVNSFFIKKKRIKNWL